MIPQLNLFGWIHHIISIQQYISYRVESLDFSEHLWNEKEEKLLFALPLNPTFEVETYLFLFSR